jgi:PAS domain S-box-containing protein
LLAIANGVRHYKAENIQKTLDGERRHVLISNLFPTEAEQFHEVLSTVVDITPLKLTNEALRASEDRYHKMMQMASDAIFVADMQTRMLVDVNDKAQQLVGRNREELLSMPISDLYPPHDQQSCSGTFIDRQRAQNDVDICEIMDSRGKRIPVEISTSCITLDERILCLGIFRDITERRKQERLRDATLAISVALRQAAERSEILPILLQQLLETLNAEGSAISHHEQQRAMFEQACGDWLSLQHESWLLGMEENTWRDEHPFAIYNQPEDRPDLPWLKGLSPGMAVMQAPLITREKVLGYLWVGREHAWEDTDGRILASVAELAANALQRVTFREELERRLEYLQALFKLDKAVAGNLDLNLIFRVLLEQVTSQLGVDATSAGSAGVGDQAGRAAF